MILNYSYEYLHRTHSVLTPYPYMLRTCSVHAPYPLRTEPLAPYPHFYPTMGAELCLAHDIGGWRHWGPLSVDMQPYGCFIQNSDLRFKVKNIVLVYHYYYLGRIKQYTSNDF